MYARIFMCSINRKSNVKVHATKLQSYFLQFEHIPFTTIEILSRLKCTGKLTDGIGISLRQYV